MPITVARAQIGINLCPLDNAAYVNHGTRVLTDIQRVATDLLGNEVRVGRAAAALGYLQPLHGNASTVRIRVHSTVIVPGGAEQAPV